MFFCFYRGETILFSCQSIKRWPVIVTCVMRQQLVKETPQITINSSFLIHMSALRQHTQHPPNRHGSHPKSGRERGWRGLFNIRLHVDVQVKTNLASFTFNKCLRRGPVKYYIYVYPNRGKWWNKRGFQKNRKFSLGMDSWEKTYSCDQQLTPAECKVLTQVSYVFYLSIFLEQNYFKMFDCFHHLSKSHNK